MTPSIEWNPATYAKNARFVSDLGEPVLQLLNAKPGESILDLGCGDGALTIKIAAIGCDVYGIDSSLSQVRAARARGLRTAVMDGRRLCFRSRFDAVFTNAALHWITPAESVVAGVWNCLKTGGRFVGEFGGEGNVAKVRAALHAALGRRGIDPTSIDPWYYPSTHEYAALLENAGFAVDRLDLIPRATKLPGDIVDWLEIFAQPFIGSVAAVDRGDYLTEVRRALQPNLLDDSGNWIIDYVRLRFSASKPAGAKKPDRG
jgi:trans-aconitate methyltransferase